jgi:hypothetical protein
MVVDQARARGQWVALGTYPVAGPEMTILFAPQVAPPSLTSWLDNYLGVAASAARATCS